MERVIKELQRKVDGVQKDLKESIATKVYREIKG